VDVHGDLGEAWEKGELEDSHVVTVDMDDNPYLDARTKKRVLAGLSEEERRARKEGRFVHFGGLIYNDFERARHVDRRSRSRPKRTLAPFDNQLVYVGIDPGQRFMAAAVFVAADGAS
jgi:hypothetical protein